MIGSALLMAARLFHADHLLLGDAPPISDAAVVVDAAGVVRDVGRAEDVLPRHAGATISRVRGVMFPGLVNAHTHIELSVLRGRVPGGHGFVSWVDALLGARSETMAEEEAEALDAAARSLARAATVAVGDVTNTLGAVAALAREGIGGAVFHEVFGQERDAVMRRVQGLRAELEEKHAAWPTPDLSYAPAPHTLYTTHPEAVRALIDAAMKNDVRSSLHLAEHPGERRAIENGDGPVVTWFEARTKQTAEWPKKPLFDHASDVTALREGMLLVHLTEARRDELERVAESGAAVVLCPRSNLFIEAKLPPLLAVREAGIAAALGTDSLASNTSLDVLAEAKALADRFPRVPAWELFQMATWNGARALGRTDLGRVAKDTAPGLFVAEIAVSGDPADALLANLGVERKMLVKRT